MSERVKRSDLPHVIEDPATGWIIKKSSLRCKKLKLNFSAYKKAKVGQSDGERDSKTFMKLRSRDNQYS